MGGWWSANGAAISGFKSIRATSMTLAAESAPRTSSASRNPTRADKDPPRATPTRGAGVVGRSRWLLLFSGGTKRFRWLWQSAGRGFRLCLLLRSFVPDRNIRVRQTFPGLPRAAQRSVVAAVCPNSCAVAGAVGPAFRAGPDFILPWSPCPCGVRAVRGPLQVAFRPFLAT